MAGQDIAAQDMAGREMARHEQAVGGLLAEFQVRPGRPEDARGMAILTAAVAEERDGIATEPPVDIEARAARYVDSMAETVVAVAGDQLVGMIHVHGSRHGFGDIGMLVDRDWRGKGVGSALLHSAIDLARRRGLHKLCLEVFPHNAAGIALYRKCGFVDEGVRVRQYRRASGELWDSIMMGLPL